MNPAAHKREQNLLKVRCHMENKYNRTFVETYRVNVNEQPITAKFYSKPPRDSEGVEVNRIKIQKIIQKYKSEGPREKYTEPVLESHCLGWYSQLLMPLNRTDRRFFKPHISTDLTKHGALLAKDKTSKKEKFTGVPFLTQ